MTLINGDKADMHLTQLPLEELSTNPLGRDIEEFVVAKNAVVERPDHLLTGHARMDSQSTKSALPQVLHLVLHQGDKRGNHQTEPFHGQRRHLKGDGLSTSCRHQAKRVLSTGYTLNNLLLDSSEGVVPPVLTQYVEMVHDDADLLKVQPLGLISSICSCTSPLLWVFSSMV